MIFAQPRNRVADRPGMHIDPASVFLWMAALMIHGRRLDDRVGLGDLVWNFLLHDGPRVASVGEA